MTAPAGPVVWLLASRALGRPVPVDGEPYPHVCGAQVAVDVNGKPVELNHVQCAACATSWPRRHPDRPRHPR